jgi:hypothetical protein
MELLSPLPLMQSMELSCQSMELPSFGLMSNLPADEGVSMFVIVDVRIQIDVDNLSNSFCFLFHIRAMDDASERLLIVVSCNVEGPVAPCDWWLV